MDGVRFSRPGVLQSTVSLLGPWAVARCARARARRRTSAPAPPPAAPYARLARGQGL